MEVIPLQPVPSQKVTVALANQRVSLNIYEKKSYEDPLNPVPRIFVDIAVSDVPILFGTLANYGVPLIRETHWPFSGDLMFVDMEGFSPPVASGLGTRWLLVFVDVTDNITLS